MPPAPCPMHYNCCRSRAGRERRPHLRRGTLSWSLVLPFRMAIWRTSPELRPHSAVGPAPARRIVALHWRVIERGGKKNRACQRTPPWPVRRLNSRASRRCTGLSAPASNPVWRGTMIGQRVNVVVHQAVSPDRQAVPSPRYAQRKPVLVFVPNGTGISVSVVPDGTLCCGWIRSQR